MKLEKIPKRVGSKISPRAEFWEGRNTKEKKKERPMVQKENWRIWDLGIQVNEVFQGREWSLVSSTIDRSHVIDDCDCWI